MPGAGGAGGGQLAFHGHGVSVRDDDRVPGIILVGAQQRERTQ